MNPRSFACYTVMLVFACSLPAEIRKSLHDDWRLQSACKVTAGGESISTPKFSTDGWLQTSVPSTVLAAQVKAGVFPDPYFGSNLRQIPGASYPVGHNFANLPMPADSPYTADGGSGLSFLCLLLRRRAIASGCTLAASTTVVKSGSTATGLPILLELQALIGLMTSM